MEHEAGMITPFEPYVFNILASYGMAAIGLGTIALTTLLAAKRAERDAGEAGDDSG